MLSVVIPSYNEAGLVLPAAQTIGTILAEAHIEYELIFVDDGSRVRHLGRRFQAAHREKRRRPGFCASPGTSARRGRHLRRAPVCPGRLLRRDRL